MEIPSSWEKPLRRLSRWVSSEETSEVAHVDGPMSSGKGITVPFGLGHGIRVAYVTGDPKKDRLNSIVETMRTDSGQHVYVLSYWELIAKRDTRRDFLDEWVVIMDVESDVSAAFALARYCVTAPPWDATASSSSCLDP